ncbi:MAG TPA: NAD-dependent epimerase/dehydratase family protein [Chloroflexia bacterium]|nr:NAD-dependent epimerase/dehydratase family protein [Chloroflexia bacterium]
MRYFVTGATGFIGGRVARQLRAAGHDVVALARHPERAGDLAALGVEVRPGEITDRETLRGPMTGVDGVFHIAGWNHLGVRDTAPAAPVNVAGTRNVLETMRDLGIPKGVYTSTVTVFGDTHGQLADESYRAAGPWLTVYDRTKWRAHYEVAEPLQRAGLPLVIVQPGPAYGPGDAGVLHETFVQFLQGKLPMAPSRTALCLAHVEDVAQGHILAMERGTPGESYIIAGPPHTFLEIMALAAQISGVPAPKQHPPPGLLKGMAAVMDLVGAVVPLPPAYSGEMLRSIAGVTYLASNAKARRELGYDPRPLADGLRETLAAEMAALGMPVPAAA